MRFLPAVPLLSLLVPAALGAQELELFSTDRPDITEAAARVGRNAWQLETGWSFVTGDGVTAHSFGNALLRIGVNDHLELRLFVPSAEWSSIDGAGRAQLGDYGGGAKLGVSSADGSRAAALLFAYSAPTRRRVQPAETWEVFAAGELELPADFGASSNAGARWELDDLGLGNYERYTSYPFATLSLGRGLSPRASVFLEIVGEGRGRLDSRWSKLVDGGGSLALGRGIQVDGSIGRSLEDGGDWLGGLGISKRW